ncbi:hypothetical protein FRY98_04715 [Paenibacillus faecis]|uniref:Uncharacterized protein n=1 Tax=Paenibacillus faecis TaxID=862114 RepID=A0A5D0CY89_9BACL|nr:hypothetical protein [Paenibacillus faecis]TYA14971.1 hypothetical protein FRY98_04715 [Paenibacillus faecis]
MKVEFMIWGISALFGGFSYFLVAAMLLSIGGTFFPYDPVTLYTSMILFLLLLGILIAVCYWAKKKNPAFSITITSIIYLLFLIATPAFLNARF